MTVVIEQRRKIDRMKITVPLNPDQYSVALSILHGIADVAESKKYQALAGAIWITPDA